MKRLLAVCALLCLLLHWHQTFERCRRADQRAETAREELRNFEETLKEWPQLRRQASLLHSSEAPDPNQLAHPDGLQVSFQADKLEDQPIYRMHLRGPRAEVTHELQALAGPFCLTAVDLQSLPQGEIQGEATLVAVP